MLLSTIILGWIGILIFLLIALTYKSLTKNNEYAFLHLLMAMMYAMCFPLPPALYQLLISDILLVGTIFGVVFLVSLVITMALQTGHIAFIIKHNEEGSISDQHGNYMMATLTNPLESLLGVFKSIWAIFLGLAFWKNEEIVMAVFMFIFSLMIFYYLMIMLDASLVKRIKLFAKVKPNPLFINFVTFLFFLILVGYITFWGLFSLYIEIEI